MKKLCVLFLTLLLLTGCKGRTVIKNENFKLSNTEFAYHYWTEFNSGKEAMQDLVDLSKPLDTQMYDETRTWQDYLTQHAIDVAEETMALALAAQKEGFELPAEYEESLDDVMVNFTDAAMGLGYKNVSAYLKDLYGRGAEEQSFREYLYCVHLASAYADELSYRSEPSEEDVLAYMDTYPARYGEDGMEQARQDLHSENYNNAILTIINGCTFEVDRDHIRITAPKGPKE